MSLTCDVVIRRQLPPAMRCKFDSIDVVQSVWVDVLHGIRSAGWHFTNTDQLRAFLVKAARNRFIDRVRQHGRPWPPSSLLPRRIRRRTRPSHNPAKSPRPMNCGNGCWPYVRRRIMNC